MLQGKYADAEDLLMEALERVSGRGGARSAAPAPTCSGRAPQRETTRVHERAAPQNNGDPETLINLAVCAQNTGKGTDVVNRYLGYVARRLAPERAGASRGALTATCPLKPCWRVGGPRPGNFATATRGTRSWPTPTLASARSTGAPGGSSLRSSWCATPSV